jgi:hypothetical protein
MSSRFVDDDPDALIVTRSNVTRNTHLTQGHDVSDNALIRLARLVKVEGYRRRSTDGSTSKVRSYVRKDLDSAGFGSDKTKRGAYVSMEDVPRESAKQALADHTAKADDATLMRSLWALSDKPNRTPAEDTALGHVVAEMVRRDPSMLQSLGLDGARPKTNAFRLPVEDRKFAKRVPSMTPEGPTVKAVWSAQAPPQGPPSSARGGIRLLRVRRPDQRRDRLGRSSRLVAEEELGRERRRPAQVQRGHRPGPDP